MDYDIEALSLDHSLLKQRMTDFWQVVSSAQFAAAAQSDLANSAPTIVGVPSYSTVLNDIQQKVNITLSPTNPGETSLGGSTEDLAGVCASVGQTDCEGKISFGWGPYRSSPNKVICGYESTNGATQAAEDAATAYLGECASLPYQGSDPVSARQIVAKVVSGNGFDTPTAKIGSIYVSAGRSGASWYVSLSTTS